MAIPFPSKAPRQYTNSKQMIGGDDFNNIAAQLNSAETGITATPAGTQATSYQLKSAVNVVSVVATANDGVKLPKGFVGLEVWIKNADAADSLRVFPYVGDTINNAVPNNWNDQAAANVTIYKCISVSITGIADWITK